MSVIRPMTKSFPTQSVTQHFTVQIVVKECWLSAALKPERKNKKKISFSLFRFLFCFKAASFYPKLWNNRPLERINRGQINSCYETDLSLLKSFPLEPDPLSVLQTLLRVCTVSSLDLLVFTLTICRFIHIIVSAVRSDGSRIWFPDFNIHNTWTQTGTFTAARSMSGQHLPTCVISSRAEEQQQVWQQRRLQAVSGTAADFFWMFGIHI